MPICGIRVRSYLLGTGRGNAINKAWDRMWRKALSLPPAASGPAILKIMGMLDAAFRARKPNPTVFGRAHKSNPNSLVGNAYRSATDGPGRRTEESAVILSRWNPLAGSSLLRGYDYERRSEATLWNSA